MNWSIICKTSNIINILAIWVYKKESDIADEAAIIGIKYSLQIDTSHVYRQTCKIKLKYTSICWQWLFQSSRTNFITNWW